MLPIEWSEAEVSEMTEDYEDGKSAYAISKEKGVSSGTIIRLLERTGCNVRSKSKAHQTYDICDNYFTKIDTPDKAYWIGFIVADGSIEKMCDSWVLSISLKESDRDHLLKFRKALSSTHPIKKYRAAYKIAIGNKTIGSDLVRHGIMPNKWQVVQPLKIEEHLLPHYWRGVFDGDGCIDFPEPHRMRLRLTMGSKGMVDGFSLWANDVCDGRIRSSVLHERETLYVYGTSGALASVLAAGLYDDSSVAIRLDRKYNLYRSHCDDR